ncbi:MAG: zinc ABC transporter substrate-binding protein [Lentisphaeria bacterium]|nr:zinc ABC transporter substrate-binding protein [Lentisphaeria bacterium]
MNKLLTVLLVCAGCVLAGADGRKVNCTTYPVWLITREITAGVKNVRTELMIPAGTGCPHEYVLTPADMRKLGAKNLIVVRNGLGLDDFVLRPLEKMNPKAPVIDSCASLAVLHSECGCHHDGHDGHNGHDEHDGHQHGHGGHDEHDAHHHHHANPHLFASPDTALGMARNIAAGLCKADPENAEQYRKNVERFAEELGQLVSETEALKPLVKGKAVAVQHGVFDYLARLLGLEIAAEIRGEGTAPSASEMRKLVKVMRTRRVGVIFTEPQYSAQTAETLARECGISVCRLDPLASGPSDPPPGYYLKTMRENLKKIRSVLVK